MEVTVSGMLSVVRLLFANVDSPMVVTPAGMVSEVRALFANAWRFMVLRLVGRVTEVSWLFLNASKSMVVSAEFKVSEVMPEPLNAMAPMVVTPAGRVTAFEGQRILVRFMKPPSPMLTREVGRLTDVTPDSSKAYSPTVVMVLGNTTEVRFSLRRTTMPGRACRLSGSVREVSTGMLEKTP